MIFTTMHDSNYESLAQITFENKKKYCKYHHYPLIFKTDHWNPIPMGFEKALLIQVAIKNNPDCKWVFFSECDTFITKALYELKND